MSTIPSSSFPLSASFSSSSSSLNPYYNIAVIGGGVIGLSTILCLLEEKEYIFSSQPCRVKIYSDKWTPNTTSDGAGALWELREEAHREWATDTFKYYESYLQASATMSTDYTPSTTSATTASRLTVTDLLPSSHQETGIAYCDGIQWLQHRENDFLAKDVVPWYERVTSKELDDMNQRQQQQQMFVDGWKYRSIIVDSPRYMQYLMMKLKNIVSQSSQHTIEFITRKIERIDELMNESYDIIINATGLGASKLLNDKLVHPIRGQTIRIHAPHIQSWICAETVPEGSLTYILPRRTSGWVVCGGTYQVNDNDDTTLVRKDTAAEIWKRCVTLNPRLTEGLNESIQPSTDGESGLPIFTASTDKVVHWTGLRPGREGGVELSVEVRTRHKNIGKEEDEHDKDKDNNGPNGVPYQREKHILFVNNYGHGGCGHSLHWGCARDVVKRLHKFVESSG